MSSISPIIGRGAIVPAVASSGAIAATTLPVTGANTVLELAVMAAAGLAVWATVYGITAKFNRA